MIELSNTTKKDANAVMFDVWREYRQKARTDLIFLCNTVLGYTDVSERVHGKMVAALQKFEGGEDASDKIRIDGSGYKPAVDMWQLKGGRRKLVLIPRGHLKSTVCTIAHTIQWIINYPDIRILISTATQSQATKFIQEIEGHFRQNEMFRFLFPEFCPQGKNVKEFGTQEGFTVPCRKRVRKEPTVSICTVGSVVAGGHFDVIKNDDLVDKENVRTPEQIENVKSHFGFLWPLLETSTVFPHQGWMDVIGTRYDFSDLYGTLIDAENGKKPDDRMWEIVVQSSLVKGASIYDKDAEFLWPERVGFYVLKGIFEDPNQGPSVLSSQYLMNPIPASSGLVSSEKDITWTPQKVIDQLYASLELHCTVDLAGMEPSTNKLADNDYTVLNLHGFSRDGSVYFLEIHHGRYTPYEVIRLLFEMAAKHPRLASIKIEKEAHARVLLSFLKREQYVRKRWLPIMPIQRDNRTSKQQRIKGLQPWFLNKTIRFADTLPCRLAIVNEVMRFPKYAHDDILDTIADAMQGRDGGVATGVIPADRPLYDPSRPLGPAALSDEYLYGRIETDSPVDEMTGW